MRLWNDEHHQMNSEMRVYQESVAAYEMECQQRVPKIAEWSRGRVQSGKNGSGSGDADDPRQHSELLIAAPEDEGGDMSYSRT